MNLLLDTHAFIWLDAIEGRLSTNVLSAIENTENTIYLSLASVWELQIKIQAGKIKLSDTLRGKIESQSERNAITLLPIRLDHILALSALPAHHNDPFDRLLIAQARTDKLTLVTTDTKIRQYDVPVFW